MPITAAAVAKAVEADATLGRRQWLGVIRARRDAGDIALARASLERFVQVHPGTRLPDDLRALLD